MVCGTTADVAQPVTFESDRNCPIYSKLRRSLINYTWLCMKTHVHVHHCNVAAICDTRWTSMWRVTTPSSTSIMVLTDRVNHRLLGYGRLIASSIGSKLFMWLLLMYSAV